jgi:hypothetical protein
VFIVYLASVTCMFYWNIPRLQEFIHLSERFLHTYKLPSPSTRIVCNCFFESHETWFISVQLTSHQYLQVYSVRENVALLKMYCQNIVCNKDRSSLRSFNLCGWYDKFVSSNHEVQGVYWGAYYIWSTPVVSRSFNISRKHKCNGND